MEELQINIKKIKKYLKNKEITIDDELSVFEISAKIDELNVLIDDVLNKQKKINKLDKDFFEYAKPFLLMLWINYHHN